MLKKLGGFLKSNPNKILFVFVSGVIFFFLYMFRLGGFIRGDSVYETPKYLNIMHADDLLKNLVFGPIKFLDFLMLKIDQPNSTLFRLISVFVVALSLVLFYRLILKWQTQRIAVISTAMLGTSSFVLGAGRFTFQDTVYLLIIPSLLLIGTWLRTKKYVKRIFFAFPATAVFMYFPGFLLFFLFFIFVFRKRLLAAWRFSDPRIRIVSIASGLLILVPMIYGLFKFPKQYDFLLGIDRFLNSGISEVFESLIHIPKQLFISGINNPLQILVGSPIIDIVTIIFMGLGIFAYTKSEHTLRARMLFGLIIVSVVSMSLSSQVSFGLILPLIYIFASKGIAFLLQNWFTVFPRNPAARNLGVTLIFIPIILSIFYNTNRYFFAWPESPETIKVLSEK